MLYSEYVTRIIEDGIKAATEDYGSGPKLDGSVAGFNACRGKTPEQLVALLTESRQKITQSMGDQHLEPDKHWYLRCYELEVEWVVNCVSAVLVNEGRDPLTSYHPTARAVMKMAEVVGVAEVH